MRHPVRIAILLACLVSLTWASGAHAASLVPIGDFDAPIYVTSDPGNADRLLVAEREGRVVLVEGANRSVYADLGALVQCCGGERGLLSIAAAPDFATSGRFYAAYTGTPSAGGALGDIHVDAFRPNPGGGAPLRERIATIGHSADDNHNGGQLQFGPDGYLYVSTGDGGGAGDPEENAQDLNSLLGKVLRIEPRPGETPGYAIPSDNPFVGVAGLDEIWSYGLRNPWRFSFDRLNGDLVIADVGQARREEVDLAVSPGPGVVGGRGANYGWNCMEGSMPYSLAPASCDGLSSFTEPVFEYPHADPGTGGAFGCSITGGYVVRDPAVPELYGRYLYADFCEGELRSVALPSSPGGLAGGDRSEGLSVLNPVSFGEDAAARIYVVAQDGPVYRLVGAPPVPIDPPQPAAVASRLRRPLVVLQARRAGRRAVKLVVRVLPCEDRAGRVVYVNRNGREFRQRRLNRRCVARFRVRVRGRTRFRAFFEGQRSQVRKIAFAKPRP